MDKANGRFLQIAVLLAVIGVVASHVVGADSSPACCDTGQSLAKGASATHKAGAVSLAAIHKEQLPALHDALDKAIRHIEAGDHKAALTDLRRAQSSLKTLDHMLGQCVKPKFANTRCPIMGAPISPENVAPSLVRDHQGQQVAFCCAGCPAAWDQLSDTQKKVKLARVCDDTQPEHEQHRH